MESMRKHFDVALPFDAFIDAAKANFLMWHAMRTRVRIPDEVVEAVEAVGGSWHLLVLAEDWCGDAVTTLPVLAALAERAHNLDLRVLSRDTHPVLMNAHMTGQARSIPIVMVLDADFVERGWWGPRPSELQTWATGPGRELERDSRYRQMRGWYARNRGESTLAEVLSLLERVARPAAA